MVIGGIYIIMCLILSGIAKWLEARMRRSPKISGNTVAEAEALDAGAGPAAANPRLHEGTVTEVIGTQQADEPPHRH